MIYSLDSDEKVNYALMINTDSDSAASPDNVRHASFAYDTVNISELRLFLNQLHTIFKNQTSENEIINLKRLN